MNHFSSINRLESLNRLIPDLFIGKYKTVLYIGARNGGIDLGEQFRNAGYEISILEIFPPNVEYLKTVPWVKEVFLGDARTFSTNNKWDVVFWWHGPEHIQESEIPAALENLKKLANKLVITGNPWGRYEQESLYGNIHEIHISHLDYTLFESCGYTVECLGQKNVMGSNITSVLRL